MKKNVFRLLAIAVMFCLSISANAQVVVGDQVDPAIAAQQAKAQENAAKEQQKALKAQEKADKQAKKAEKEAKKKQHTTQIKEIRLSTFIEEHDIMVKAKTGAKFLKDGNKLKVSLRFRGRERDYVSPGQEVMEKFAEAVSDVGVVEKKPKFEGRSLTMILSPRGDK